MRRACIRLCCLHIRKHKQKWDRIHWHFEEACSLLTRKHTSTSEEYVDGDDTTRSGGRDLNPNQTASALRDIEDGLVGK